MTASWASAAIAATHPALRPGEVHLWHLALDAPSARSRAALLDAAERERAARLRFERDRTRYVNAHAAMREILGAYLGVSPAQVRLRAGAGGKPALADADRPTFNLSHSGGLGLPAVSEATWIGVDIEALHAPRDLANLARSVFTAAELRELEGAAEDDRANVFLAGWTRKEAYLKALGIGLQAEPATVHVGLRAARDRIAPTLDAACPAIDVATVLADGRCIAALACSGGWERVVHYRLGS